MEQAILQVLLLAMEALIIGMEANLLGQWQWVQFLVWQQQVLVLCSGQ